ncbi:spindle-pole body protein (Pcp1) [Aspergillus bombycis]|uniref:Spindle-pole body protein (Pcp1) n=1 Tax=Aspergillus bombycis TaxID=109264 RepID=A0A1F8A250_9EURO|nr:spindle-pole body protein (Pcp1) [Aspergillus bombycis]OGM45791.1 spindle-pole body protein (Pcp1) [Aspergillus bombycis]
MVVPYIDTPRTEVDGNATYLTNGFRSVGRHNLSALDSVENSFQTPSKDEDLLKGLGDDRRRSSGAFKLSTPRAGTGSKSTRNALNGRHHLPTAAPPKGEFTPLMRSAAKNNFLRNMSTARGNGHKTPAYMKEGRSNIHTPGLPSYDMTGIDEEDETDDQPTPLPQAASSSVQSTPLPGLSGRGGNGLLNDGQNMTLREQEKIIDKLDKDNFGLKLKIHYLQEQLEKAGPSYNQAALKENTELKVSKLTMQRDISRYKKSLQQAERDLEAYRVQFQELREKVRRGQLDETSQREMNLMREELESKDHRVRELQEELRDAKDRQSEEIEKLRDEIEDLEASLREKERTIDERDEELEELKDKDSKENGALAELESELQRAKEQMEELQDSLDQAKSEAREARESESRARSDKEEAEKNLQELHDEMANKSISTKGLTRQLEEKSNKLEEELRTLQEQNSVLKEELERKARNEAHLEENYQRAQQSMNDEGQKLHDDVALARHERNVAQQERDTLSAQLQEALDEIQRKTEEKELLQTRHYALTDESGGLQDELAQAQSRIRELQHSINDAKEHALEDADTVRTQYREEIERLQEEIEALNHEIEDKEGQFALEQDRWESTKRALQLQKDRAEDQAAGFKRTIEKLEQVEHTLTGKETKLQEVIDSEKARHFNSEAVLSRQVKELNDELLSKRQIIDDQRTELLSVKEELRLAKREEVALTEKVQALEDEVVVLQANLEEEREYAKGRMQKGSSDHDNRLQNLISEKQKLRDQLANAHVELHDLRTSMADLEAERDELQSQVDQAQHQVGDTTKFDKEKVELRKSTLRLEGELKRLREEKSSLVETKEALEKQLSAEVERATMEENRLAIEIDQLQDKLQATSGGKDRELTSAKSKTQRLERRVQELEALLEHQPLTEHEHSTPNADLSMLRHNLDEARKREKTLLQREADQKASVRSCKSRIAELERELHDTMMRKFEDHSHASPSDKLHEELRSLRKQLSEAHRTLRELKIKNRDLERAAMREEDQRDLHELLRSSTLEAESLALKVSERDARLSELRAQVRRIREERAFCARKAEAAIKDLDSLQERYNQFVEKAGSKSDSKSRHDKEILGLGKEIIWLRARLKREEKFRRDLAWSKGLMELGERVRVACNEADLRMISEMGVKPRDRSMLRSPRQKLKTGIFMVKAIVRMQRMGQQWQKTKKIGEGLKRAKNEVLKRREASSSKASV